MPSLRIAPKVITLTDAAAERVKALMAAKGEGVKGLKIGVKKGGCAGMEYTMVWADKVDPRDEVIEQDGAVVLIEPSALMYLLGAEMDFKTDKLASQFVFNNPNQKGSCGCGESVLLNQLPVPSSMATPTEASATADWAEEVLGFWFGLPKVAWFERSDDLDRECARRFEGLHARIAGLAPHEVCTSPRRSLAAVIVMDQFSRNMFRGTPRAFASDAQGRAVASEALTRGHDAQMTIDERAFLYLPFEHSEEPADQARCVSLFAALGDADYLSYAEAHKAIIDRFGRFPHRNAILGRTSTAEEMAFLAGPGSSF